MSPPLQTVLTGLVVAIVGFFSSFPIVLQGLSAMGASPAQAGSGLMMAALAMGLSGILLSQWTRMPVSIAWSTPGAALLAVMAAPAAGYGAAIGAFVFAGFLTLCTGLWKPLARLVAALPPALAQAMLAGVLLPLCLKPFAAIAQIPTQVLPVLLVWFVIARLKRLYAVPAAVLCAALMALLHPRLPTLSQSALVQMPEIAPPLFDPAALLSIGLPLFIVTMATQNAPGLAVLRGFGYTPPPGRLLGTMGVVSMIAAPFGSPATCVAAITASMCSDPDSHPDKAQRYWSATMAGLFYCLFGLGAIAVAGFAATLNPLLVSSVAGIALFGVLTNSLSGAFETPETRESAALTFVITASGMTFLGVSAPLWGLCVGGISYWLARR